MMKNCRQLVFTGALAALFIVGCGENEPASPSSGDSETPLSGAPVVSPEVYMNDPAFRESLKEERHHRNQIVAQRTRLLKQLEKKSLAMVAKMPNATEEEVVAELEKDPEWNSLKKRVEDLVRAYDESRAKTLTTVRKRIVIEEPVTK